MEDIDPVACRALWVEVVRRAIMDLSTGSQGIELDQLEAFEFFLADHGGWAQSRQDIFDLLGLDEASVRHALRAELASPPKRADGAPFTRRRDAITVDNMLALLPRDREFRSVEVQRQFGLTSTQTIDRLNTLKNRNLIFRPSYQTWAVVHGEVARPPFDLDNIEPAILDALKGSPRTVSQLVHALDGYVGDGRIRETLRDMRLEGAVTIVGRGVWALACEDAA